MSDLESDFAFQDANPALLLIDLQQGFADEAYWGGNRNNPHAEEVCGQLLTLWRAKGLPLVHIRHSSTNPVSRLHASHPGFAFHAAATPLAGETVITKQVNSGFIGTNLAAVLQEWSVTTLVIGGLTTNHCVSTTARMAGNYGYHTLIVSDATATFDRQGVDGTRYSAELMHQTALASLHDEFGVVVTSRQVVAALG